MNIQYVGKSYPDMYGVVVHANIISMIMEEDFINTVPEWISITLLILIIYSLMSLFTIIREKFENWFEPTSVMMIFAAIVLTFLAELLLFHYFLIELNLRAAFFALSLSGISYEAYNDSLKPIFIDLYKRIKNKFSKKNYEIE